jgi:hypothetical protein
LNTTDHEHATVLLDFTHTCRDEGSIAC